MRESWREWSDDLGLSYLFGPYVVRQHGLSGGQMWWVAEGPGMERELGTDPAILKLAVESHVERHARLSLPVGGPPGNGAAPEVDPSTYAGDLRELMRTSRALTTVFFAVNPNNHRDILRSRESLEQVRAELTQMIERLP
jgi:hypothetical protein